MTLHDEIENLVKQYSHWVKDKTTLKVVDDQWIQITTPFLDRHNDCLQIYAKKERDGYLLTDDGYILNDLINVGCDLKSHKRQELLKITLNGFGVFINCQIFRAKSIILTSLSVPMLKS